MTIKKRKLAIKHKYNNKDCILIIVIILIFLYLTPLFGFGLDNFQSWLVSFLISIFIFTLSFFIKERTNKIFFIIISVFILSCAILNFFTSQSIFY